MTDRFIFNPYTAAPKETATASATEKTKEEQELATASALTNINPEMCPKCGGSMCTAFLYNKKPVFYCDPCRVTHPKA